MTISPGTKLGSYEVLAQIGVGGMGEVYRAHDTRLNRDVALKVLPEAFARDTQRMARFEREAKLLASLNHPHIASIYGLEESGSTNALVMELVEGPTLADRIVAGPIPLDEALPIAKQIAEALEHAHDHGVIHRDLKPANIKVKPDGTVKVLDFGLAKALSDEIASEDISNSPTLSMAATRQGVILGTAAYMSPEQAKGKTVDRRADVWAFGCVLYEMLTGKQAFDGEDITEVLAAIVMKEPAFDVLPAKTPHAVRILLRRCLAKDLRQRLQHMGEARFAIEHAGDATSVPLLISSHHPTAWITATSVLLLGLVGLSLAHFRERTPPAPVLSYTIPVPKKTSVQTFALSPDGRYLVLGVIGDKPQLWLRSLDSTEWRALPGTENGRAPFWSPDSRWIGFFALDKLKKISLAGGPAQTLCDVSQDRAGSWNKSGEIIFGQQNGPLLRVSAAGGEVTPATKTEGNEIYRYPFFLPDGRHFLYLQTGGDQAKAGIRVGAVGDPDNRRLLADQSSVIYVPSPDGTSRGHLMFLRGTSLMAQAFDANTLQFMGEPFSVAAPVAYGYTGGWGQFSASAGGILVYMSGNSFETQVAWYDRSGKELQKVGAAGPFGGLALSPDEKTVAIVHRQGGSSDVWLRDLVRDVDTRFTFGSGTSAYPVWSPDGNHVAFSPARTGHNDLFWKDARGTGQEEELFRNGNSKYLDDWSRDGKSLLFAEVDSKTLYDLWTLPMTGDRKPIPFLRTEFDEVQGQFSPDVHWVAYASDESGQMEIYVRPFPAGEGKWRVSNAGGFFPRWRRDGKEMYYLSGGGMLMAVPVKLGSTFEAGASQPLFAMNFYTQGPLTNIFTYAVSGDGQRFLVDALGTDSDLNVVVNWANAGAIAK